MNLREELADLMHRHAATIFFTADEGSDFHGITGEQIVISTNRAEPKETIAIPGYGAYADDLSATPATLSQRFNAIAQEIAQHHPSLVDACDGIFQTLEKAE
jgi:hypothetical protein